MTKTKRKKIISGIFAFLPLSLVLLATAVVIFAVFEADTSESSAAHLAPLIMGGFSGAVVLVMVILFGVDAYRNESTCTTKKVLLLLMLLFGTVFTVPIYWLLYIHPATHPAVDD